MHLLLEISYLRTVMNFGKVSYINKKKYFYCVLFFMISDIMGIKQDMELIKLKFNAKTILEHILL